MYPVAIMDGGGCHTPGSPYLTVVEPK